MLLPGKYYLDIGINGEHGELYDNVRNIMQITVRDYVHNEFGPCTFEHDWEIVVKKQSAMMADGK